MGCPEQPRVTLMVLVRKSETRVRHVTGRANFQEPQGITLCTRRCNPPPVYAVPMHQPMRHRAVTYAISIHASVSWSLMCTSTGVCASQEKKEYRDWEPSGDNGVPREPLGLR